ncbi:hypothetical protein O6H91_20G070300 [Diphasiastrum complanatum]|uniref:Uncharacterized protein n=1 Tax=Diphasiastrum complanatum TaxID=34168 RepID=A0ACC2ARL9_DIPCM|nr:hypothetical protein O6H91_20G070300 [Diphasiastrum complanatum]
MDILFFKLTLQLLLWLFTLGQRVSAQTKETIVQFYMHDNVLVPNATTISVAGPGSSNGGFGTVVIMDDLLTEGPSPYSKLVGRGQGTYILDSLVAVDLLLTFSAVFDTSKYNGTLSFHGSDRTNLKQREIAVVGGTGVFRFARGYAIIETYSTQNLSAILFFNVTIHH